MNPCNPRDADDPRGSSAASTLPHGAAQAADGGASAPEHPTRPARKTSRVGKWRAVVLVLVQLAIVAHVLHWWQTGETISPLEPSESMQFTSDGLVNAGVIFFAVTILSTLLFGRFFCGWGCHIVALQDACGWLMKKIGVRPKLVNLGVLWAVPWITCAYMFLYPIVRRLVEGTPWPVMRTRLSTDAFWQTFPAWPMAIVTILVVGFLVVYFLGAKAYCNYGCPYGAFFGIADQLAPVRIRVTDACAGCGHCTAACTSNVRVHEEVREWKAVVDPGCMKCLDCVSVCPTNALYVGFGTPAIAAVRRAAPRAAAARAAEGSGQEIGRWVLLALFFLASYALLTAFNGEVDAYVNPPEWKTIGVMAAGSLAVAFVFRGKANRARDYTLSEEVLMAVAFLVSAGAFRGLGYVPLLLAMGFGFVFAWGAVTLVRLSKRIDVRAVHRALKNDGRLTAAGRWFALAMFLSLIALGLAANHQRGAARTGRVEFARMLHDAGVSEAAAGKVDMAITTFQRALTFDPSLLGARENLAGALCARGRFAEGIAEYGRAIEQNPNDPATRHLLGIALLETGDVARAIESLREAVRLAPDRANVRLSLAAALEKAGLREEAAAERRAAAASPATAPR